MAIENIPIRIQFNDPDDMTDWDYEAGPDGTDDPEAAGWRIQPMGGVQFRVTSPGGDVEFIDGVKSS